MKNFPQEARLWIYATDRTMSEAAQASIQDDLMTFFADWRSHGRVVHGTSEIWHNRFIAVSAYLQGDISGCGIDASVHAVEQVCVQHGFSLLPAMTIFYQDASGNIQAVSRPDFRAQIQNGNVSADTTVFDTALTTLRDLEENGFTKPAAQSWHGKVFRLAQLV